MGEKENNFQRKDVKMQRRKETNSISLTPGFSRARPDAQPTGTVSTVSDVQKTVKTVFNLLHSVFTSLKRGVNENFAFPWLLRLCVNTR